jgi:hypothetical protein
MSKKTPQYTVALTIGDKTFEKKGSSILDALSKMKVKDYNKKMGKVSITYQGKKSDIPLTLNPYKIKSLFAKPFELEIFAKRLEILR